MLSKSQYLVGLECPKALYNKKPKRLNWKRRYVSRVPFTVGNEVGEIAKQYYEGFEPETEYCEVRGHIN